MKTAIVLTGLLQIALAINQPKRQCTNFLKMKAPQKNSRGRSRRAPQGFLGSFLGGSGDSTDSPVTTDIGITSEPTTYPPQTRDPDDLSTTTFVSIPDPTTTEKLTTLEVQTPTPQPEIKTDSTSDDGTTVAVTSNPNVEISTEAGLSTTVPGTVTLEPPSSAIIVMLDETGSMQDIGGKGKGRNLVIRKMEMFRKMINKKVKNNKMANQEITFVTFNEKATWTNYNSIDQWPIVSRANYNPGYQTNLYDAMGCVLSQYKSNNPNQKVSLYLISDGIHAMSTRKQRNVAYGEGEIEDMVEDLRQEGWDFHFYGATTEDKKDELKQQALGLGFRKAEQLVFDFNGKQFGALLKTMLKTMVENGKEEVDQEEDTQSIPICEECPKGRAGFVCRKRRKNNIAFGKCRKA